MAGHGGYKRHITRVNTDFLEAHVASNGSYMGRVGCRHSAAPVVSYMWCCWDAGEAMEQLPLNQVQFQHDASGSRVFRGPQDLVTGSQPQSMMPSRHWRNEFDGGAPKLTGADDYGLHRLMQV